MPVSPLLVLPGPPLGPRKATLSLLTGTFPSREFRPYCEHLAFPSLLRWPELCPLNLNVEALTPKT